MESRGTDTSTAHLGKLEGPILIFGGPYSNLEATCAVLEMAASLDIPPSRILCTGDSVAYCADPEMTARTIRDTGISIVMGNCEEALAQDTADCGCGFSSGSECANLAVQWYAYARRCSSQETKRWMEKLPREIRFTLAGWRVAVVHATPSSINEFIFPSTPVETKQRHLNSTSCDVLICGHSGIPFTQVFDDRVWHNAGSIGLPANDGTPRGWYSILHEAGSHLVIEHRALDYDYKGAAEKMRRRGLPAGYANALETGLWPSCDVLPAVEWSAGGRPLTEERAVLGRNRDA